MNAPINKAKPDKDPAEETTPSGKKQDYHTNMPVGEILRRAREHFGQSLNDVEAAIRIRVIQIDAIEKSQYDKLPGRVYAIGFVRSYSEYLGFDGDKMVALFKTQSSGGSIKPELNFPAPASESRLPPLWLVVAGLFLFGVFLLVWTSGSKPDPEESSAIPAVPAQAIQPEQKTELPQNSTPAVPDATTAEAPSVLDDIAGPPVKQADPKVTEPVDAAETGLSETIPVAEIPSDAQTPVAEDAAKKQPEENIAPTVAAEPDGITLNVIDNSWVEIKDETGKAIVSRMLKSGDQYFVPNRPDLKMSLGNAGGIEVVMDGKTLPPLGKKGEVRRNISLDIKALKALAAAQE